MKKFTDFKPVYKKLNEDVQSGEMPKANLPEETNQQQSNENVDISKFFSKLLESREMAHIYHLTVKGEMGSHAAHKALQEYYEGILEFIDEMIEVYQGQYGIIEEYDVIDTKETKSKDKIEYFQELVEWVKTEKKCINQEDSHLLNIVDEAVALMYKTLYKLRFNK